MGKRDYKRTKIEEFGKHLLETGDLDPIYLALYKTQKTLLWADEKLFRWLLAYFCFYDSGVASYLSEVGAEHVTQAGPDEAFWDAFQIAAANSPSTPSPIGGGPVNGNWTRGKERRHFRGQQAIKATNELRQKYPNPGNAIRLLCSGHLFTGEPFAFKELARRVKTWRGFGEWISFKVGDMLDRIGLVNTVFEFDEAMYADPTKAALMQWKVMHNVPQDAAIDDEAAAVREVVDYLIKHFSVQNSGFMAPPLLDRSINLQEVETILCKWKSHIRGFYPPFNDTDEIVEGIKPWALVSPTASTFSTHLPFLFNGRVAGKHT